jgi:hypothetical protein
MKQLPLESVKASRILELAHGGLRDVKAGKALAPAESPAHIRIYRPGGDVSKDVQDFVNAIQKGKLHTFGV